MPRSSLPAVLLVDGYNMIGAWSMLQKICQSDGLEAARRELVETLVNYSAFQGFETQVVFDAQYQDTATNREVVTHHLSVYYTAFGQTADTYIEKVCALFRHDLQKFHKRLIVATSDRAQQLTVVGYGAECLSAQQLAHEVESAVRRMRNKKSSTTHSSRRFLANALDPVARQRLARLRLGLKTNDP